MLLTEEEAKERWCPFARNVFLATDEESGTAINTNIPSGNRTIRTYPPDTMKEIDRAKCIASQCMAWRFVVMEHRRETELWSRSKNKRVNSAWGDDSWWRPIGEDADKEPPEAVGYCGLAGTS